METKETRPRVGVGVMVKNNKGQILLGLRKSEHGQGTWSFPGGKLEFSEKISDAVKRETEEETGLKVDNLELVSLADELAYLDKGIHYVNIGFLAHSHQGEPEVKEKDKFVEWRWFDMDDLPDNVFIATALMIERYQKGKIYF